jgi:sirohydrochlorin ferrochelatase
MEIIILVGHGSPRKEANSMDEVARLTHAKLHPGCGGDCVRVSYLAHGEPSVPKALDKAAQDGQKAIIVHPFFLNSGLHVTESIPAMLDDARARHPQADFIYTEPLGISEGIVQTAIERIRSATGKIK